MQKKLTDRLEKANIEQLESRKQFFPVGGGGAAHSILTEYKGDKPDSDDK